MLEKEKDKGGHVVKRVNLPTNEIYFSGIIFCIIIIIIIIITEMLRGKLMVSVTKNVIDDHSSNPGRSFLHFTSENDLGKNMNSSLPSLTSYENNKADWILLSWLGNQSRRKQILNSMQIHFAQMY